MLLVRSLLLVPYVYIAPPRHPPPMSAEHAQTAPCCQSDSHTWKKQYRERFTVFTIHEASRVILSYSNEIEKSIMGIPGNTSCSIFSLNSELVLDSLTALHLPLLSE